MDRQGIRLICFDTYGVTLVPSPRYLQDETIEALDTESRALVDEPHFWRRATRRYSLDARSLSAAQAQLAAKFCRNLNVWAKLPALAGDARLVLLHPGPAVLLPFWQQQHALRAAFADVIALAERGLAADLPGTYAALAQSLGVQPSACLVVNDELGPVEAARADGCAVYRFGSVYGLMQTLASAAADG